MLYKRLLYNSKSPSSDFTLLRLTTYEVIELLVLNIIDFNNIYYFNTFKSTKLTIKLECELNLLCYKLYLT